MTSIKQPRTNMIRSEFLSTPPAPSWIKKSPGHLHFRHLLYLILVLTSLISCKTGALTDSKVVPAVVLPKDSVNVPKVPVYDGIHIQSTEIVNGYTDSTSCFTTDSTKIYLNAKDSIHNAVVKLFTVNGIQVDSVKTTIVPQKIVNAKPWEIGYGYKPTFTYSPSKLASGVYLWENKIPMIVKTNQQKAITVLYPSNTENAYCESGGFSMYSNPVAAVTTSFLRPILLSQHSTSYLEWINSTPYGSNMRYIADVDMEDYTSFKDSKILIIIGHSEYWTRQARLNFDRFIDEGNDAIILSGNTMWWQVRYDRKINQLICYKNRLADPCPNPLLITINWCEAYLKYFIINSIGGDFDRGGYGQNDDKGWNGYKICLPNSPLLEGTNLKKGDIISLPTAEYDGAPLKKFDNDGYPVLDNSQLKFNKFEIIGFDLGYRDGQTCGTFMVMKKSQTSGTIINGASLNWCSPNGLGGKDAEKLKIITTNMIEKLLNKANVFSN